MKEYPLKLKLKDRTEYILWLAIDTVRNIYKQAAEIIFEDQQTRRENPEAPLHIIEKSPDHPQDPSDDQKRDAGSGS